MNDVNDRWNYGCRSSSTLQFSSLHFKFGSYVCRNSIAGTSVFYDTFGVQFCFGLLFMYANDVVFVFMAVSFMPGLSYRECGAWLTMYCCCVVCRRVLKLCFRSW